jgi:hypothetical protein
MKNTFFTTLIILISLASFISCKKTGTDTSDNGNTTTNTNNNNGNNNNNNGNPPVSVADSGFVIVYTNDPIYTDPDNGTVVSDKVIINVNNLNKGNIQTISTTGTKVYYNIKNALSLKVPTGSLTVKGNTSSGVSRTLTATVIKNDTVRVKLDFSYNDPHANTYYIQYSDNGVSKKVTSVSNWIFYVNNHQAPSATLPGCTVKTGVYNYDGPNFISQIVSVPSSNIIMRLLRSSWKLKPDVGSYSYTSAKADVSFSGAVVNCTKSDSYATVNISEVKITEDMGLEKRGYYTGTFDAIVYYTATFGAAPEKHVITNGKFQAFMGGISFN